MIIIFGMDYDLIMSGNGFLEGGLCRADFLNIRLGERYTMNFVQLISRRYGSPLTISDRSSYIGFGTANTAQTQYFEGPPDTSHDDLSKQRESLSLQKWEGVVMSVSSQSFIARLYDLMADKPEEEAEFLIDKVLVDDRGLIKPGAFFYWSIGYFTCQTSPQEAFSIVKFRRMPGWSNQELRTIDQSAKALRAELSMGPRKGDSCGG